MKVLIMSDTHGLTKEIDTIKDRHDCDLIIHCGDSELQSNTKVLKDIEVVKGNCDVGEDFNTEKIIDLNNGVTCLVTHGHLYDVKQSLQKLSYRADELSVNFCFFGHTHVAGTASINNTFFINPGSLKLPRNSTEKTYAILELETTNFNLTFYNDEGIEVEENKLQ